MSAALVSLLLVADVAPASADPAVASAPTVPATSASTTSLPEIPGVGAAVTAGQPALSLLSRAVSLVSAGMDDNAMAAALAVAQQHLDVDAQRASQAETRAAAAGIVAARAVDAAASAERAVNRMSAAVRQAAVTLYVGGTNSGDIDRAAGSVALYAADYLQTAEGPYGVLARWRSAALQARQLEVSAAVAKRSAAAAQRSASGALSDEQAQVARLDSELRSLSDHTSAVVASEHESLAAQVARELGSGVSSLQFTPRNPPPDPVSTTSTALTWAFAELGHPYLWGAAGPSSFDCSGLTQFVWHAAGVRIPRVASDQYRWTVPVPLDQLLPGDLVFFGLSDVHHVGIYIGGGLMINAPHTGDVVRVSSIWWSDLVGFGRVHAPGTPVPPHEVPSPSAPAPVAVVTTAGTVPSQRGPTPRTGASPAAAFVPADLPPTPPASTSVP